MTSFRNYSRAHLFAGKANWYLLATLTPRWNSK